MNTFDTWLTIVLLCIATVVTRACFFLLADAVRMPARLYQALRYAPATAFAAIVVPDLLMSGGAISLEWLNPKLLAGAGATVYFLATRQMLGTIVAGMLLYTGLRLVI